MLNVEHMKISRFFQKNVSAPIAKPTENPSNSLRKDERLKINAFRLRHILKHTKQQSWGSLDYFIANNQYYSQRGNTTGRSSLTNGNEYDSFH
jgi:hypothetical protein